MGKAPAIITSQVTEEKVQVNNKHENMLNIISSQGDAC